MHFAAIWKWLSIRANLIVDCNPVVPYSILCFFQSDLAGADLSMKIILDAILLLGTGGWAL